MWGENPQKTRNCWPNMSWSGKQSRSKAMIAFQNGERLLLVDSDQQHCTRSCSVRKR